MAEIWPRLKKKFACDPRRRKKSSKSKKANPYASGLEKFAALLEGVRGKKASSLVERTGASVSAARSLSRSAQEWTASTLARTASRRSDSREGSNSPEIVLLHCAVRPSDAQTRSSEYTESFSFAEAGFNPRGVEVEESETDSANVCESVFSIVGSLHRDLGTLSEDRQSQGGDFTKEEASPSAALSVVMPVKTGRCMTKIRGLQRSGWKQTSNSAFVVLVALGAFISSRFGKVVNPLAAVLAFNALVRIWLRGKLYARFMFSSVALYFLTRLRSYVTYCPRRLSLLPRKLKVIADTKSRLSTNEVSRNLEIQVAHEGRDSSLETSVVPLQSAPLAANQQGAPLSLLLTIPESSAAPAETQASSAIEPVPMTVFYKASGASSPSRRLAKKVSSRFKKLKMFRSSSSFSVSLLSGFESSLSSPNHSGTHFTGSSEPGSPISPSLHSSAASSPDRHRKCPFSRRLHKSKSDIPLECVEAHSDAATVHATEKKLSGKKSRLCRVSSTETLDIGEFTGSPNETTPTSRPPAGEEATDASRNVSWPVVGLLVTSLFLLVGRLPAIMATSLFLLVISNAHHDRAHPRSRGREARASEAARKLHRSPPPRRHPGSPPRRY